ncbi:MAG: DUF5667 domain-containing protein [Actinomycetota bacterium]|nr:DUF5667 domain-containing protein [Actinomycetota bacterium]
MRTTHTSGGQNSGGQEQERFARAVDGGVCDAADRAVQRDLAVVAALREVGAAVGPNPVERDRMRQRVMAEFSSVVHDGSSPVMVLRSSRETSLKRRWIPEETRGRLVIAAAAALCLLMSLSGMSVLLSRDALPGDALYSFKRTAESAELGLTFGDQPKALKHLEFASARVNEIEIMADQADAAGNWSAGQGKFLRALDDFDGDTTAAARLLTGLAINGEANSLSALRGWAEQQKLRLSAVRAALPLRTSARVDSTLGLLDRVVARASALSDRSGCVTITSGTRDDLGLLPAKDACKPTSVDGTSSAIPLPDVTHEPVTGPLDVITPPSLLPPTNQAQALAQSSPSRRPGPGLPSTRSPRGVLPKPSQPRDEPLRPEPWRSEPWHPLPGHDSSPPAAPLPPWILQPQLLPPG